VTNTRIVDTTVGRALLLIVPKGLSYDVVNLPLKKKAISKMLINQCYRVVGLKETVIFADQLMYTGFAYATVSGVSVGVNDFVIPDEKAEHHRSAATESERDRGAVRLWPGYRRARSTTK
jgi:DNA-directed RNA polymerase subunit beta'